VDPVNLVFTWSGGLIFGAGITIGMIELVTGHMVIFPRRVSWTVGEVKVYGLVTSTVCSLFAIETLVDGLVLSTSSGPTWSVPAWWYATVWVWFLGTLAFGFTALLLEQHHKRRWPFVQRRLEGNL
jgi:hypothetical protein